MRKPDWLSAREAATRLDVKLTTLYSYVSRGLIQSVPMRNTRGRLYAGADVERLKARHDARAGHAAVAAGALRWGEPTLETQISDIRSDGPYYRGISALALLERARSFECAAELIWTGVLPNGVRWPQVATARAVPFPRAAPIGRMALELSELALSDRKRRDSQGAELARARWLLARLAGPPRTRAGAERAIAAGLLHKLGGRASVSAIERLDRALILCIDHELNASTFSARVAASAGAELFACVAAGLHTLSGVVHGGVSARLEALLDEIAQKRSAARVVRAFFARGEHVPGFGHPLYPQGDPRCRALIALSEGLARSDRRLSALHALIALMQAERGIAPNLDAGLVALSLALGLRPLSAASLFAVGRVAGYVAHILEQRAQGYLLRPRARYIGG